MPRQPERKRATVGGAEKRPRKRAAKSCAPFRLPPTTSNPALIDAGGDQVFRQMLYDLFTLSVRMDAGRKRIAGRISLTPPQYNIMMVVAQDESETAGASVSAVASRLHVSQAFVATETTRMAAQGFIEKLPNPADGRGVLLRLSPRAEKLVIELAPHLVKLNDLVFGGLSKRDFRALSRIAAQVVQHSGTALSSYLHAKPTVGQATGN